MRNALIGSALLALAAAAPLAQRPTRPVTSS